MELLRFDDAGSTTPQRKKSSRGMLAVGLVATLFGISSAFATTTVSINSNEGVSLGQGVTLAAACDNAVGITPITEMRVIGGETPSPTFFLEKLKISDINPKLRDTGSTPAVNGCGGQTFDVQIFNTAPTPTAYSCADLQPNGAPEGTIQAIEVREGVDPAYTGITCTDSTISFQVTAKTDAGDSRYDILFDDAPSAISYVTLVTRES